MRKPGGLTSPLVTRTRMSRKRTVRSYTKPRGRTDMHLTLRRQGTSRLILQCPSRADTLGKGRPRRRSSSRFLFRERHDVAHGLVELSGERGDYKYGTPGDSAAVSGLKCIVCDDAEAEVPVRSKGAIKRENQARKEAIDVVVDSWSWPAVVAAGGAAPMWLHVHMLEKLVAPSKVQLGFYRRGEECKDSKCLKNEDRGVARIVMRTLGQFLRWAKLIEKAATLVVPACESWHMRVNTKCCRC